MSDLIDVADLQSQLTDAARTSFGDLIEQFRGDRLYGFALYTVDELEGIVPSASTEVGFEERKQKLLGNQDRLKWLKSRNIDVNETLFGDYRWSVYDWEHECHMIEAFESASDLVRSAETRARASDDPDAFDVLSGTVLASMVVALRQLDLANLFTQAQPRESLLVCSKPSSSDSAWLERESARLLNPPSVFEVFQQQRIAYISDGDDSDDESTTLNQFRVTIKRSGLFDAAQF